MQVKFASVDAGLIHCDLFEAGHQVRRMAQAAHEYARTFLRSGHIFVKATARKAARHIANKCP
jgi:hypothetical protein